MEILYESQVDKVVVLSHDRYSEDIAISILFASNNMLTKEAIQYFAATLRKVAEHCDNIAGIPDKQVFTFHA